MRPGTSNTPAIVGMGKAIDLIMTQKESSLTKIAQLKKYFLSELKKKTEYHILGSVSESVPHIVNIALPNSNAETLLMTLDQKGIAVSHGAACSSGAMDHSHVLTAMNIDPTIREASLRISFGSETSKKSINMLVSALTQTL